ncbi:hypothetical protein DPMN_064415 [Dreissena polymorpha]|uniref:Uncharacterized protein n=1 Tax=Dreissena polymorpha TaxID=45954 RepID=A0A9D4HK29_DREPO|nr:hypothetical protein DPMN_064415 [Dreissena polymorpha]
MLEVSVVQDAIQDIRTNIDTYYQLGFSEATTIAAKLDVQPSMSRICGRQTKRDNKEARTPEDYYKRNLTNSIYRYIPQLDDYKIQRTAFNSCNGFKSDSGQSVQQSNNHHSW